ncbi:MAG: hypothetical protein Q9193_003616 [Seirophora villosa]
MAASNNATWTILIVQSEHFRHRFYIGPPRLLGENYKAANAISRKRFSDDLHALQELRTQLKRSNVTVDKADLKYQDKAEWQRHTMTVFGKVDKLIEELEASKLWRSGVNPGFTKKTSLRHSQGWDVRESSLFSCVLTALLEDNVEFTVSEFLSVGWLSLALYRQVLDKPGLQELVIRTPNFEYRFIKRQRHHTRAQVTENAAASARECGRYEEDVNRIYGLKRQLSLQVNSADHDHFTSAQMKALWRDEIKNLVRKAEQWESELDEIFSEVYEASYAAEIMS